MTPKKKSSDENDLYALNEKLIRMFFKQAISKKEILWPDDAMRKVSDYWIRVNKNENLFDEQEPPIFHRTDNMNLRRQLHLYAVNLFYESYAPVKKGAPRISDEYNEYILKLSDEKKTYREMAKQLKMPVDTPEEFNNSKEVLRKRISAARKKKGKL